MGTQMKGLTQFIADLRNSRAQEEEDKRINTELVNIQKLFLAPTLNGYQRKKYVCKLIYIYILGHKLSLGYMEAIQLLSSKVYSEKEIGYLAISLLLNENHEMMTLVINSVKNDLEVDNYDFNCLALHALATIANEEMSQFLAESVFQLVRSPATPPFVKKKAALALLRMIKVNPAILVKYLSSWLPRIIALLDQNDADIGLFLSVISFVSHIAKKNPDSVKVCIPIIIKKLNKLIIERECPSKYVYNGVLDPWLTVKLFNLIEDLILIPNLKSGYSSLSVSNIDTNNLYKLRQVVAKAIENGRKKASSQQALNAQSAILFSAISLATRLDPSPDAITGAIDALSQLLASRETNTRYLALNALIKIVSGSSKHIEKAIMNNDVVAKTDDLNVHKSIKKHTLVILKSLRDKDVSVRQKSLDALFLICDFENIEAIIDELLVYLSNSDYLTRTKISLKIYRLAEKFAKDLNWYVTNSLKIISISGSYASPEIWSKFIKVIVNSVNNSVKIFACKSAFGYLRGDNCNDFLVKIAAFLLGEYGDLVISEEQDPSQSNNTFVPWNQFIGLYDKYFISGVQTKYVILNAFVKFYKKFPELRVQISKFYRQEINSINTEIQQRSVEYLKLISRNDDSQLLNIIVEEMPEFMNVEKNHILIRLEKSGDFEVKDLISLNGESNEPRPQKVLSPDLGTDKFNPFVESGSDDSDSEENEEAKISSARATNKNSISSLGKPKIVLSPNWEDGFYKLLMSRENVFFENSLIRIVLRFSFDDLKANKRLKVTLRFFNKSPTDISSFITNIKMLKNTNPPVIVKNIALPESSITRGSSTDLELEAVVRAPYFDSLSPILEINFLAGGFTSLKLKLPIALIKCVTPTALSNEHFGMRWDQLEKAGNANLKREKVLKSESCNRVFHSIDNIKKALTIANWGQCLDNSELYALKFAGIVHTSAAGNFGTLLNISFDKNTKSLKISVRSTNEEVPDIILNTLENIFTHK